MTDINKFLDLLFEREVGLKKQKEKILRNLLN